MIRRVFVIAAATCIVVVICGLRAAEQRESELGSEATAEPRAPSRFVPSKQIPVDQVVDFPVDI